MKITHIIWSLTVGGAESMLVDIINEQSKNQELQLIVINNIIEESVVKKISNRVNIHRVHRPSGSKNPYYIFLFNYILIKFNPDIIHMHKSDLIKIYYLKNLLNSKIFLTVHSTHQSPSHFKKFDKIIAISNSVKKDIVINSGIKTETIHNGVNTYTINVKHDYTFHNFKIIQIGRLYKKQKGQHILLEALSILTKNHGLKNISVDFIGNGESEDKLFKFAKHLNVMDFCSFMGQKDRDFIYSNLKNYNLLVQPSIYEGFGLTVVEAVAAKVPVLVSNIEGPMEIINHGEFGYHFNSCNSSDCAKKVLKIIQEYGSKDFMTMLDKGQDYVLRHFDIKQTAQSYLNSYKKICS